MNTTDVTPLVAEPAWELYEQKANELFEACKSVDHNTIEYVRKFHPRPDTLTDINRPACNITMEDTRLILAREHGFENSEEFRKHVCDLSDTTTLTWQFECAADAIITGDLRLLKDLLSQNPDLTKALSTRAHRATLLHYIAANGVENYRQRSPANAVEMADLLLAAGSEPDELANVYDQKWGTTLDLLVSSVHPAKAGVQVALVEKLILGGAAINGIRNDGSPLHTAIYFRYPRAAEELLRLGARVDNVAVAAALGLTDVVADNLDGSGHLLPGGRLIDLPWINVPRTPEATLELALVWAAMHNRADTVSFLLEKGVKNASRDHQQWTALHWAAYLGYPDIVRLLMEKKAPLEARNEFGGTVLDQTIWATVHEGVGEYHIEIIRTLIDAGARIHSWWLFAGLTPPLDDRVADVLQSYEL
jgi:ankyrin repeat protein